ncbi:MAG: PDZ domain-containing protein [Phycisphaerae bacterium]
MKALIWSTVATVACTWVWQRAVSASDTEEVNVQKIVTEGEDGQVVVVLKKISAGSDDGSGAEGEVEIEIVVAVEGDGQVKVLRKIGGGGRAMALLGAADELEPLSLLMVGDDVDEDAGWLGVQLGAVSKSATEESADAEGVSILNVAEGSPADAAGFEKGDVLIEVDDVAIDADLKTFVDLVREAGPGDRMKFTVLRDGERRTLVATLGRRAEAKDATWIHKGEYMMLLHDTLRSKAKVLRRGEGGGWHFEMLHDDAGWAALPDDIMKLIPRFQCKTMRVFEDDDEKRISIAIVRDGEAITIKSTDNGGIEVKRTDTETGKETVTLYANRDELEANDQDAFKIYSDAGNRIMIQLDIDPDHDFDFDFDFDDDGSLGFGWVADLEKRMAEQSNALAEVMERLQGIHAGIKASGDPLQDVTENTFLGRLMRIQARQTIRENPDGTIDVVVRKGTNELVTRYSDADDLADRNPDTYDTYLDLKSESQ